MAFLRCAVGIALVFTAAAPSLARASIVASQTTSYDGSYTLSWGDASVTGSIKATLAESVNGGAWASTPVTGTYSKSFTGKAPATYAYKIQIYWWDGDTRKWAFIYETNTVAVLVTNLVAAGAPGAFASSCGATSQVGNYQLTWNALPGVVDRYELYQNGVLVQSSLAVTASYVNVPPGTYSYRVRACLGTACGPYTADLAVTVEATLTTTLPDDAFVAPVVPAQDWNAGALPGSVSTDGGAAGYRVDVVVPPGRAGIQPSVALAYSSKGGNGVAGVGWSLTAGGSIYRCPRTLAQEGGNRPVQLDGWDRLCMNGQRLVAMTPSQYGLINSVYHTEVEQFNRVTLLGGSSTQPASYFQVEHKSGQVTIYSSAFGVGGASTRPPDVWYPYLEFDRRGNCMRYQYARYNPRANGDEGILLAGIWYTGVGNYATFTCTLDVNARHVTFSYTGDRTDKRTTYRYGTATMSTARLGAIGTWVGTQAVRRYEFGYKQSIATGRSLLTSVRLCAGASCGAQALPPTTFTYHDEAQTFTTGQYIDKATGQPLASDYKAYFDGDYDGDGTREEIRIQVAPPPPAPPGWSRTIQLRMTRCGDLLSTQGTGFGTGFDVGDDVYPMGGDVDIDGDGRTEMIGTSANGYLAFTNYNCGNHAWRPPLVSDLWVGPPANNILGVVPLDFDGDGLYDVDVVNMDKTTLAFTEKIYRQRRGALGAPPSFTALTPITPPTPAAYEGAGPPKDLNGDGTLDWFFDLYLPTYSAPPPHVTFLQFDPATGTEKQPRTDTALVTLGGPSGSALQSEFRRWLDVNGDGLPDIFEGNTLYVNRGGPPGSVLFTAVPVTIDPSILVTGHLRLAQSVVGDIDADGQDELLIPDARVIDYCGQAPGLATEHNVACGADFDLLGGGLLYDHSVYTWDALKFYENADGSYTVTRVPTGLQMPLGTQDNIVDSNGDGLPDATFRLWVRQSATTGGYYLYGWLLAPSGPYVSQNTSHAPDLLKDVTNGLGAVSRWTYQPLSRNTAPSGCDPSKPFYTVNNDAPRAQGSVFFASSMWAVSKYEASNGIGGTNPTCYRYEDAMLNIEGRGFQGFKKIIAEERLPPAMGEDPTIAVTTAGTCGVGLPCGGNNLRTTSEFWQEFPLTNRLKEVRVERASDGFTLSDMTTAWVAAQPAPLLPVWVVYPSASVETKFLPATSPGTASRVVTTSVHETDLTSGEPLRSCTVVDDGSLTAPMALKIRTIQSFTDAWWIGRIDAVKKVNDFVTAPYTPGTAPPYTCPADPAAPQRSAATATTWNPGCLTPAGSCRKPASQALTLRGAPEVTIAFTSYDVFGNLTSSQVTARDVGSRTDPQGKMTALPASSSTYTPDGYFRATETNPLGHVASSRTDPATGQVTAHQPIQGGPWTVTTYDALGRVLTTNVDGSPPADVRFAVCAGCGNAVVSRIHYQAGTPRTTEFIDLLGRTIETDTEGLEARMGSADQGTVVASNTEFNERGQKLAEHAARFVAGGVYRTQFSLFDALGRPGRKSVQRDTALFGTGKGDSVLVTDYAYSGLTTSIKVYARGALPPSGAGLQMTRTVDGRGKYVQTTQQVSQPSLHTITTSYRYDSAGAVTAIVDTASNTISATYDDPRARAHRGRPRPGKLELRLGRARPATNSA